METLLDYLPGASVSLDHQGGDVLAARLEMIEDHYTARLAVPRDGEVPYAPRPLSPGRLYLDRARAGTRCWPAGRCLLFPVRRREGAVGIDGGGRPGPIFAQSLVPGSSVFRTASPARPSAGPMKAAAW